MADFEFVRGNYDTADHTPASGDVAAGAGVLFGSVTANTAGQGALLTFTHRPIANNVLGTVAIGGGVYKAMIASNYAAGVLLYKPSGNAILTTTSTNNSQAGILLQAASAANDVREFVHVPWARAVA